jgi:hypothetical protein
VRERAPIAVTMLEREHDRRPLARHADGVNSCRVERDPEVHGADRRAQTALRPAESGGDAALRVAALGRKDFLFAGHEDAGANVSALYMVVGNCEAHQRDVARS